MSLSTVAWRERWRMRALRRAVTLMEIVVTGGPTLQLATDDCRTPDSRHWSPHILPGGTITAKGSLLETDIPLATCRFSLRTQRTGAQLEGQSFYNLLVDYELTGSAITVWLWERGLTSFADACERFHGVIQGVSIQTGKLDVRATQAKDWNRTVSGRRIDRSRHPQASEAIIGAYEPVLIGANPAPPMRFGAPTSDYTALQRVRSLIAGGSRVAQALLVDNGRGGGGSAPKARVLVAGHRVKQVGIGDGTTGTGVYIRGADGEAHYMEPDPAEIFNNDTDGAGFTIPDGEGTAWFPIYPVDISATTDNAANPRAILERFNETSVARLDYTALERNLRAVLPSVPNPGTMVNVYAFMIYRGLATGVRFVFNNGGFITGYPLAVPPSATEAFVQIDVRAVGGGGGWNSGYLQNPWDFSGIQLRAEFSGASPGGTMDVIAMGVAVEYLPERDLLKVERRLVDLPIPRPLRELQERGAGPRGSLVPWGKIDSLVNVTELQGEFFANTLGFPDDALGTYAGDNVTLTGLSGATTPNLDFPSKTHSAGVALLHTVEAGDLVLDSGGVYPLGTTVLSVDLTLNRIVFSGNATVTSAAVVVQIRRVARVVQRPADVAHLLLQHFGSQDPASIELTPGELGCMTDARTNMRTWNARDMIVSMGISDSIDIGSTLSFVAAASAMQIRLDEATNRWHALPWVLDPPVTYPVLVRREDLLDPDEGPTIEHTADSGALAGLTVAYGWDALSQSYRHETSVFPDASSGGHYYQNLRDGRIQIVAGINDKVQWITHLGVANTFTIAPGDYTPETLTVALRAAIPTSLRSVGVCGVVVAGVNDHIGWSNGPSFRDATLDPGTYTMEALAAHAQTKMNAPTAGADGWRVVYNRRTGRFMFSCVGSNGDGRPTWFVDQSNTACGHFGFGIRDASEQLSTPFVSVSDTPVEEGRVYMATDRRFDILWSSGSDGREGTKTCAWDALGYDWSQDSDGVGQPATLGYGMIHVGRAPRFLHEMTLSDTVALYGAKRPVSVDGRAIYDTATGVELRNRMVGVLGPNRPIVRFPSDVLGDMRIGDVFEMHSDMNTVRPYSRAGSDGSWASKRFRVLEVQPHLGPSNHAEIVCVDMTSL